MTVVTRSEPELLLLSAILLLFAFFCIAKLTKSCHTLDYSPHFWLCLSLWLAFRGTWLAIHVDDVLLSHILDIFVSSVLQFLAFSAALILITQAHLQSISGRDARVRFFRAAFPISWLTSALVGAVFTVVTRGAADELIRSLVLWRAGTDVVVVVFAAIPGMHLFWRTLPRAASRASACFERAGFVFFLAVGILRLAADTATAAGAKLFRCGLARASGDCTAISGRAQAAVACFLNDAVLGMLAAAAVDAIERNWGSVLAPPVQGVPSSREIMFGGIKIT
jgi:hypothetical protein